MKTDCLQTWQGLTRCIMPIFAFGILWSCCQHICCACLVKHMLMIKKRKACVQLKGVSLCGLGVQGQGRA